MIMKSDESRASSAALILSTAAATGITRGVDVMCLPKSWSSICVAAAPARSSSLIDLAVFPGIQGGPLEHVIAAKAIAFGEVLTDEYGLYAQQVVKNAQAMAKAFVEKGYELISGGTDNHLMLIDLRNKNISGKKAENVLVNETEAKITKVHKRSFPPNFHSVLRFFT